MKVIKYKAFNYIIKLFYHFYYQVIPTIPLISTAKCQGNQFYNNGIYITQSLKEKNYFSF
jgi:hypothetical protein